MTQEQEATWDKWDKNIQKTLQEDRNYITRAMQVDLKDQIFSKRHKKTSQKNIFELHKFYVVLTYALICAMIWSTLK
ncbi:MAG: hypothetical protein ABI210_04900 [Abditibacteriaceae bacterium]